MDASMRQKIAQTAAHLLCQGQVADMGMGSGSGSEALAALYPALHVTGVDVNETMVERARERFRRANLDFIVGDIAKPCFPLHSLSGIFNSSVLHHVTSFNGYVYERAAEALVVQCEQLAEDGVLIVRDFVAPDSDEPVWLDVRSDDGADSDDHNADDPRLCSSARLLERFSKEFRSLSAKPGFALEREPTDPAPGWRRYRLSRRVAAEFALRKDYRQDWESEVQEEYFIYDRRRFEQLFRTMGLRILASTPIRNPWIVRNRFEDKLRWGQVDGEVLDWPATNTILVGERVRPGQGVSFRAEPQQQGLGFLSLEYQRDRRSGKVFDLVRRPHLTVDVLPWFSLDGDLFIIARKSYPRPILGQGWSEAPPVNDCTPALYVTEPLTVLQDDKPLGRTVSEALSLQLGLKPKEILSFADGAYAYPSPGGIEEEVRSLLVEVAPVFVKQDVPPISGFSSSGQLRAIEASQALRAAQVSGLPSGRLETNVYELFARRKKDPGAWIGEIIELTREAPFASPPLELAELLRRPPRRCFEPASKAESGGFLKLECARFEELDSSGRVIAERRLEYVKPATLSCNTLACALIRRAKGEVYIGLDDDDLPAAQGFSGNSNILVGPAWRLPRTLREMRDTREWLRERLQADYGVEAGRVFELGGHYHPSPGVTPELVIPLAVEVLREAERGRSLVWVKLSEALRLRSQLPDGHLKVLLWRAAHALGLLGSVL